MFGGHNLQPSTSLAAQQEIEAGVEAPAQHLSVFGTSLAAQQEIEAGVEAELEVSRVQAGVEADRGVHQRLGQLLETESADACVVRP